jgi:hypothetical protein
MTVTETSLPAPYCTNYGVDLYCIGEDGEHLMAFGHVDKRRFFAACNRLARTDWGLPNLADGYDATWAVMEPEITHEYACFVTEPGSEWDWEIQWQVERDDEHQMPVTVWTE